jgi:dTDP-4-dehydrorhamnose reductase
MTDFLKRKAEEAGAGGRVEASSAWMPSCAFLEDSADAMAGLIERGEAGVFHIEGNGPASGGGPLRFYEIARGLSAKLGMGWEVVRTQTPAMDNRMADGRVRVRSVRERLGV